VRLRNEIRGFELGQQLAASGMGILVRAQDRESGKECAVKLLHPPCGMHPEDLRNFLTIGVRRWRWSIRTSLGSSPWALRMECPTLRGNGSPALRSPRSWRATGRLPEADVLALAVQAAAALAAADAQGLLHRDLRMANFILTDNHG
jgi:serine/threonine protein kinase